MPLKKESIWARCSEREYKRQANVC